MKKVVITSRRMAFLLLGVVLVLGMVVSLLPAVSRAAAELSVTPMVAAGSSHTVGLNVHGTVVAVGCNGAEGCDVGSWTDIIQVAAGSGNTVGLKSDGTVVAVGYNFHGECDVGSWTGITQVAAGDSHTVGVMSDGTVVAVGPSGDHARNYGQCDVGDWTGIEQVAAGMLHTVGLKSDGTVVAVGRSDDGSGIPPEPGDEGQLGVGDWREMVQVAAGSFHNVGLRSDGTVVAVGRHYEGQLDVDEWSNIVQVAAGDSYTVGLKSDGTVVAVGCDGYYSKCDVDEWNLATTSLPPDQPSNTSPTDGAWGISLTPTLIASAFSDPDAGDTHAASQWQVRTSPHDSVFPVFDSGRDTLNLTSITIPSGALLHFPYDYVDYYWRVRYQDNHNLWSQWSTPTLFIAGPQEIDNGDGVPDGGNGEVGGCCASSNVRASGVDLAIVWGILGLCCGTGLLVARRVGKRGSK